MNVATGVQGSAEAVGQGAPVDKYMYHNGILRTKMLTSQHSLP